jgi:hypothetical protein
MEEKDVVSSENLKGKHLSTFLWTPHEHDVPKLHAKFILLQLVKLVIAFRPFFSLVLWFCLLIYSNLNHKL